MNTQTINDIQAVMSNYFYGIYEGDVARLESAFDKSAVLYGDIKGAPYLKDVPAYIEGVASRKPPKVQGEVFGMKVTAIEVLGNNAVVKAHLPMLGYNYYDFLSLSKLNGQWKIVNKLFTHVDA
ncbi:hypothetical protein BKI52_03390 [marine bacterium AO1-C]|nr:hypothetical protein BKI52_03390 [marine bacterium AO1-C]